MVQQKCREMGNALLEIYKKVYHGGTHGGYGGEVMEEAIEKAEEAGKGKILPPDMVKEITSAIQERVNEIRKAKEEHRWIENGHKFELLQYTLENIMFDSVVACERGREYTPGRTYSPLPGQTYAPLEVSYKKLSQATPPTSIVPMISRST